MHFLVGNNGGTEAMTILNSGYVGIGNSSPGSLLTVSSLVAPVTDIVSISNSGYGTVTNGVDGLFIDFTAAADTASDTNTGLNISYTPSAESGDTGRGINVSAIGISAGTLYGINIAGITAGAGTEKALVIGSGWDTSIDAAGTIIGGAFSVVGGSYHTIIQGGSQSADLTLTLPITAGSSGQALTTNGSGTLSWSSVPSGSGALNRVAYWSDASTLTSNAGFTFDGTTLTAPTFNASTVASGFQANSMRLITNQGSSGSENLFLGQSGNFTTTGTNNIFAGYQAGLADVAGVDNISIGYQTLYSNTYGAKNVAIGSGALYTQSYANGNSAWDTLNTAIGYHSLYSNQPTSTTNGYLNTALGSYSLQANTIGARNVAIGSGNTTAATQAPLYSNVEASDNIAIGNAALRANTYAEKNIAIGTGALYTQSYSSSSTPWDSSNIAIGYNAMYAHQPTSAGNGVNNIAIGSYALDASTTGALNIAIGKYSLTSNTGGYQNIAMGQMSLGDNVSGNYNIAIGYEAGRRSKVSDNVFIGTESGNANTYGAKNVALGSQALYTQSYANGNSAWDTANVAIGYQALYSNQPTSSSNGYHNTALGYQAGYTNATGASNVFLGYKAGYYETSSNKLFIDNQQRASEADARTKALVYGIFDASTANQSLTVNGSLRATGDSAPTSDIMAVSNSGYGTTTTGVDGLSIDFTQTTDSGADTNTALNVSTTASGESGDTLNGLNISTAGISAGTLNGINIGGITAGSGTEYALVIGSGWDRGLSVDSVSTFNEAITLAGNARPTRQITLSPEFPGATMSGDGGSNTGTMTSDFCAASAGVGGLPATNTSVCNTSGDLHNYYSWTTSEATAQDYDIWIRWRVPDNFSAWASNPIDVYGKRTDTTNNAVTVYVYDTAGTLENSGGTQVAGTAWTSTTVEASFAGTYTPGAYMTIQIHVVADTGGDSAQVGEINLDYLAGN